LPEAQPQIVLKRYGKAEPFRTVRRLKPQLIRQHVF
jgi:hypothetical protein